MSNPPDHTYLAQAQEPNLWTVKRSVNGSTGHSSQSMTDNYTTLTPEILGHWVTHKE